MSLIQITDTIFVNPNAIDTVEIKVIGGKRIAQVKVNGMIKNSTIDPKKLIEEIKIANIDKWQEFRRY